MNSLKYKNQLSVPSPKTLISGLKCCIQQSCLLSCWEVFSDHQLNVDDEFQSFVYEFIQSMDHSIIWSVVQLVIGLIHWSIDFSVFQSFSKQPFAELCIKSSAVGVGAATVIKKIHRIFWERQTLNKRNYSKVMNGSTTIGKARALGKG